MTSEQNQPRSGGAGGESGSLRFLCTNDDGIHASGLGVLVQAAQTLGDVYVVAPDRQRSGSSQSLTLNSPISMTELEDRRFALNGTPTDCVLIAIEELFDEHSLRPHFVLSGVNHGANMGEDVLYSGTVAAAIEGTILDVPSIAVSFTGRDEDRLAGYADLLERLLRGVVAIEDFPEDTLLNINLPDVPAAEVRGARVTSLGSRRYWGSVNRRRDAAGREVFWIGGGTPDWKDRSNSDFSAVDAGYVSITPLHLDLTNFGLLAEVREWPLEL